MSDTVTREISRAAYLTRHRWSLILGYVVAPTLEPSPNILFVNYVYESKKTY